MNPLDRAKLSGLIDGELPLQETEAVRRAIQEDPELRREYEELVALDAACRVSARAGAFQPNVSLPYTPPPLRLSPFRIAVLLLLLRAALKAMPSIPADILEAIMLTGAVTWMLLRLLPKSDEDLHRLTHPRA